MNHHPLGSFQFLVDRAFPLTNLEKPCLSTGFLNFIDHRRQGWSDLANLGEMMHQAGFLAEGVSTLLECSDITHWLSDESIWYLHHFSICFPIAFIHIVCRLESRLAHDDLLWSCSGSWCITVTSLPTKNDAISLGRRFWLWNHPPTRKKHMWHWGV